MSKTSMILRRSAGSLVGLLTGGGIGLALGWFIAVVLAREDDGDSDFGLLAFILIAGLSVLVGTIIGAAAGASLTGDGSGERGSFWKALLGAVIGLVVGGSLAHFVPRLVATVGIWLPHWWAIAGAIVLASVISGAVIGSGWKAKAASTTINGS